MKRTIIAVSFIVLLFAFCLLETEKTDTMCDNMENRISVISNLYENGSQDTMEKCEKLKKEWAKEKKTAVFFINHSFVDEITDKVYTLPAFVKTGSDDMFFSNIASIKKVLSQIKEDSRLTADSFY